MHFNSSPFMRGFKQPLTEIKGKNKPGYFLWIHDVQNVLACLDQMKKSSSSLLSHSLT
jgi:hypothetical protein